MKKVKEIKGITLIALIITIIILLILAGITIGTLTGDNGLFARAKEAKIKQLKAQAKENIQLAIMDIQIDDTPNEEDVNLKTLHDKLPSKDENITVEEYQEGESKLHGTYEISNKVFNYKIDDNFNVIIEDEAKAKEIKFGKIEWNAGKAEVEIITILSDTIEYQINSKEGTWTKGTEGEKTVRVTNLNHNDVIYAKLANGTDIEELEIKDIIKPEEFEITVTDITANSLKISGSTTDNQTGIKNYTYVLKLKDGDEIKYENKEETPLNVTTSLMPGTEYTIYMIAIDNAGNQRKSKEENITTKKIEIEVTTPYIGTSKTETDASKSVLDNSQPKGTTLYINFRATVEGTNCKITLKDSEAEITLPYTITKNGTYTFIASKVYGTRTIKKEIEVNVSKYEIAGGFVQYDAGEWTEEEIQELKKDGLYNINVEKTRSTASGLNFTFGGFTYKGDTANQSNIANGTIITSRNQSVANSYGTPKYEGWQILESKVENGKTYVTKLVHAGQPENFVYCPIAKEDSTRIVYLLSSGRNMISENAVTFPNGKEVKTRNYDEYKDKTLDSKGYIRFCKSNRL